MANTNVFRGSDATLTLAPVNAEVPEGAAANTIINQLELSPVGRCTGIEVFVQTDLEEFHEVGRRHPAQLRPGNIRIRGRINRAYINGALLRLLLGVGADVERIAEPYPQPSFNMTLQILDPATPGTTSAIVLNGVKFENWSYNLPEDDFVMESVTFKALFITVADAQGA